MDYSVLTTIWAGLEKDAKIVILTERDRWELAEKIKNDNLALVSEIQLLDMAANDYKGHIAGLLENDLLIVMLTLNGYMEKGYRNIFSPFNKPGEIAIKSKYVFIRLDIPDAALLSGLNTGLSKVEKIVNDIKTLDKRTVRLTTDSGTDITTRISNQAVFPYSARDLGGNAFLPPSEVANDLFPDATNGRIVVDVTVGEFRIKGELIDELGIVDQHVIIDIEDGLVKKVCGGEIAHRLSKCFSMLPSNLHFAVELGHGLSDIEPTGIIGVDESMNGTCHIGIGDGSYYHLDVVMRNPLIEALE